MTVKLDIQGNLPYNCNPHANIQHLSLKEKKRLKHQRHNP